MTCHLNPSTGCTCDDLRGAARKRMHARHLREVHAQTRLDDADLDRERDRRELLSDCDRYYADD